MGSLYNYPAEYILGFGLILIRMSAFIMTLPLFSNQQIPMKIRVLLGITLTLCLFPTINWTSVLPLLETNQVAWIVLREMLIGVSLGFIVKFIFFSVTICGEVISLSIGLSNAQMFNPAIGTSVGVIEQFKFILAAIFFLVLNGHHLFLLGITKSFELLPISSNLLSVASLKEVVFLAQELITIGVKMAMPVVAAIFLMNVTMGIIGRAVPQINVLITSLPVNILLGFGVMLISLPLFLNQFQDYIEVIWGQTIALMKAL